MIGLLTCFEHHNYGSMLQAYATEIAMEKLGVEYKTIKKRRSRDYMKQPLWLYMMKKLLVLDYRLWWGKQKIKRAKKQNPTFAENAKLRESYFNDFSSTMFHTTDFAPKDRTSLEQMALEFDGFLVGSDQLWRTDSIEHGFTTMEWVPDDKLKVAYSTSMGVTKVPCWQRKKARRFMNRFHHIALREQSACDIVKDLTGREVPVVLDPTLLLTAEEWLSIQQPDPILKGDYILVYLLGNNPWQRDLIKEMKKRTGLKIVALQHLDEYIPSDEGFADEALYAVGPKEWLNLIRHARYVFTDSFHCSVFSILYHKEFFSFNRFSATQSQNTNTRIDNLLSLTGLLSRRVNRTMSIDDLLTISSDFSDVEKRLEEKRLFSMNYLKQALDK